MTSVLNKRIYLSPPHMGEMETALVQEAFASNWLAPMGPHVDGFERELANYVGAKGAVALSSGTAAIHLGLKLLGIGPGDFVFCSALTFVASANPIKYLGAEPIFIDCEPESWNMSPIALERACMECAETGNMPKAIVVVHLYGQSADMSKIEEICSRYNIPILEDAAESLGASYKGKATGTMGKVGIYSFNGNKIITTSGGGMLVSDDLALIERARFLAAQAREQAIHYQHEEIGFNYRMSNVLAAIGRGQLLVLEERVLNRREVFSRYKQQLGEFPGISFMAEMKYGRSNRWLTALTIDEKVAGVTAGDIIEELAKQNIESRPVWKPLQLQPVFKNAKYVEHLPGESISEKLFLSGLCLPSGSNLSIEDQEKIITCIIQCLENVTVGNII